MNFVILIRTLEVGRSFAAVAVKTAVNGHFGAFSEFILDGNVGVKKPSCVPFLSHCQTIFFAVKLDVDTAGELLVGLIVSGSGFEFQIARLCGRVQLDKTKI